MGAVGQNARRVEATAVTASGNVREQLCVLAKSNERQLREQATVCVRLVE